MTERLYKVYSKAECIGFWELRYRWKAIPDGELKRIINEKSLQLYENIMPYELRMNANVLYLSPFGYIVHLTFAKHNLYEWEQVLYTNVGNPPQKFTLTSQYEDETPDNVPRFFFLLADIERIEKKRPDYISPDLAPTDTPPLPAVPDVDVLLAEIERLKAIVAGAGEKNLTTKERNSLLRIVGGLMYGRDISPSQIRKKIQSGGFGDLSENTIRYYIKETEKVRD